MIGNNIHTKGKKIPSKIEAIPYPGNLPENDIIPEKLELATKLLRTVKNLKGTLAEYNKTSSK